MERNLMSGLDDVDMAQHLLAELHDGLRGRVARLHMLTDQSRDLGMRGAMLPGGSITYRAWTEARSSFVSGHFVATVLLCQGLMEHLLASDLDMRLDPVPVSPKATARESRRLSREEGLITSEEVRELERLESLRNPLTHYRKANDPEHIDQQAMRGRIDTDAILERDAEFAITLTMKMLSKPSFRL